MPAEVMDECRASHGTHVLSREAHNLCRLTRLGDPAPETGEVRMSSRRRSTKRTVRRTRVRSRVTCGRRRELLQSCLMQLDGSLPAAGFVSPILVGRSTQLATLRSARERVRDGLGCTMLVSGDAGIGKSRLIAAARAEALESGFQVLQATCFEPDASVPYAALLELLRASKPDLGSAAAHLAGFVADPSGEPEKERHRLFVELTRLFAAHSESLPLLLIVEDIHWCDETSLQFFRYLARLVGTEKIGILLSYRADEPAPVLAHAIAELDRARLGIQVRLNPLTAKTSSS